MQRPIVIHVVSYGVGTIPCHAGLDWDKVACCTATLACCLGPERPPTSAAIISSAEAAGIIMSSM